MTQVWANAYSVPNGIYLETQCLEKQYDGGAFADMCMGNGTDGKVMMFPEGYGVDVDKNDYIEASLYATMEGFTGATKETYALARVKILYVER